MSAVGKVLANDQIHMLRMADQAGLDVRNKHVPAFVTFDANGNVTAVHSGGFYQCKRLEDCRSYLTDVVAKYQLDGTLFANRPEFHGTFQGHAYAAIGGAQFQDVSSDFAIRIIRWSTAGTTVSRESLANLWRHHTRAAACQRGSLAQAHLLWSEEEQVVAEVTIGTKLDPPPGSTIPYFVATLGALGSASPLEPDFDTSFVRLPPETTDTYLVLTYWPGAFDPSRWPNSPSATPGGPLPEPYCGDGSCNTTVTHVETFATCPADCLASCGNGACDPGESADTCAIDCLPQ
jgi:hypothetical protein